MELSALLIKYILHKGVQLKQTTKFVNQIDIELNSEGLFKKLDDFTIVEGYVKKTSEHNEYYLIKDNRQKRVYLAKDINSPTKDKLRFLIETKDTHEEIIYWEYA